MLQLHPELQLKDLGWLKTEFDSSECDAKYVCTTQSINTFELDSTNFNEGLPLSGAF